MNKRPFATLVFRGRRFDLAALPLEVLPELAAYRELVLAVAKVLFQDRNPQRQRLPKGFEKSFRLVLERVEPGSAVPNVLRVVEEAPDLFAALGMSPANDIFDEARELVERTIGAVETGAPLPKEVTPDILLRFNAFGRTLADDEAVVVAPPGSREGAVYDRKVRRRLVLQAQSSYEDEVDLVGEVRAADKDSEGFTLLLNDGRRIAVRAPSLFLPRAIRSLDKAAQVRVRGTGLFDAEGALLRVTMASDVSLAEEDEEGPARPGCPTPIELQVESLKWLAPGWYDGKGHAYEPAALDWLSKLLKALLDGFRLPTPYLYPTPEGPATLEWSMPRWEVMVNIDLAEKSAEGLAARVDGDEIHELPVSFSAPGAESALGRFLVDHILER